VPSVDPLRTLATPRAVFRGSSVAIPLPFRCHCEGVLRVFLSFVSLAPARAILRDSARNSEGLW
jgi:hypothetical protein